MASLLPIVTMVRFWVRVSISNIVTIVAIVAIGTIFAIVFIGTNGIICDPLALPLPMTPFEPMDHHCHH